MPQIVVNSPNIGIFSFSAAFDIANRQVVFTDTSIYNNISGHGVLFVEGIAFSLVDQDGVILATIDWTAPQLPTPATQSVYNLDLSSLGYAFLFQNYTIVGAIKDSNGNIYTTIPVIKKVCQPVGFTDSGYVYGIFKVTPNIPANILSVSEITPFIYNNNRPVSITKSGNLYYPTGTISPVAFTGTPFSNNVVYSGQYRIVNTSIATYDLQDAVYVVISYYTNNNFNVFVGSKMADLNCCIMQLQETSVKRCNDAVGQQAKQKLLDISTFYMNGIMSEIDGKDSNIQYEYIKKYLNCDCGETSLQQNEINPINPSVTSIIVTGINGSTVIPSINGNTTTYTVSSNVYQVVKGNTGDLAFTISIDNTITGVTKTIITFNYNIMAGYILSAITSSPSLINQLNALVTFSNSNIDLSNLDGKCILDIGDVDYFLTYKVPDNTAVFKSITVNNALHTAPTGLLVSGTDSINAYLNSLLLGSMQSIFANDTSGSYFSIISAPNTNTLNSIVLTIDGLDNVVNFQATSKSIVAALQGIIDYLCGITALQVALGSALSLGYFDYNGNIVFNTYSATANTQNDFNAGISTSIQNIMSRINTLTTITCAKLQSLFQDYPSATFNINTDRILSIVNNNCTTLSAKQMSLAFINSITAYSDIKAAYCNISCLTPTMCPDVAGFSVNNYGNNLAIYQVVWVVVPTSPQTVAVQSRVLGTSTWTVATTGLVVLPNGNISGTSPYLIPAATSPSTIYEVQIFNNCGGAGLIKQITTPATPIYTNSYRLGNIPYLICGATPELLYTSAPFGNAVFVYYDAALTMPVTGFGYIIPSNGDIYYMISGTGQVLYSEGGNCNAGTPNSYLLGNNSSTICASSTSYVLYTNGSFAVGKVLYYDASAINTPVTGVSYIVFNGIVYNLNTSTGVIGSATGTTCSSMTTLTLSYSGGTFAGNVNNVVPFNVTISAINVQGSSGTDCTSPSESDGLPSMTLVAATNNINYTSGGLTCASTRYTVTNNAIVNGNLVTNGSTVVISGITFSIVILNTNCSVYTC